MSDDNKQENSGEGAILIKGDNVTVLQIGQLLTSLAESTIQDNFYTATGISCGRHVRQQMELLMEEHGFTSRELARAWRTHAIAAEGRSGKLIVVSRTLDLTVGWTGAAITSLFFMLGMSQAMGVFKPTGLEYPGAAVSIWIFGYMAAITFLCYFFIWPQYTAKRVALALASHPKDDHVGQY